MDKKFYPMLELLKELFRALANAALAYKVWVAYTLTKEINSLNEDIKKTSVSADADDLLDIELMHNRREGYAKLLSSLQPTSNNTGEGSGI